MKKKKSPLVLAYAVFLAAGAVFFAYRGFAVKRPPPPSKSARTEKAAPAAWSSFEKRVLLNLEILEKTKAAEAFFSELHAAQGLRRAVENGPSGPDRARFKRLVAHFADDPAFRAAVENPEAAAESAPCGSPEPVKPLLTETADPFQDTEPGCAEMPPPVGESDLIAPFPTQKSTH